ncbi:MAG: hypothetical protein ACLFTA_02070 [Candidatus Nanohaloarchaea archaeon]
MDLYNIITKIPYVVMLGIGTVIILQLYVGGLQDLSTDIDVTSQEAYRKAILLERVLNYDAGSDEAGYDYDRRRAIIPQEVFTNKDPESGEIGYKKTGGHCYIEEIPELDGQNFGLAVTTAENPNMHASNPESLDCKRGDLSDSVSSPALLIRGDNPPLEVRVHVYKIS